MLNVSAAIIVRRAGSGRSGAFGPTEKMNRKRFKFVFKSVARDVVLDQQDLATQVLLASFCSQFIFVDSMSKRMSDKCIVTMQVLISIPI